LLRGLNLQDYEVVVVSPRNHFLFTPLLASASVGTLEFRCITEPVRQIRSGFTFYQATCDAIDFGKKELHLTASLEDHRASSTLPYDQLVIACGAVPNTFGIPGVKEHAFFLKEVAHARKIRQRIIECFEFASEPGITAQERDGILNFVVVGAGPTGVEFSGESKCAKTTSSPAWRTPETDFLFPSQPPAVYDFVTTDVGRLYPALKDHVRITLVEASTRILTSFDASLSDYAAKRFKRRGIVIEKGKELTFTHSCELFMTSCVCFLLNLFTQNTKGWR